MPGPLPKPPGQRRRRNAGQPTYRKLRADGTRETPPLPNRKPAWSKQTREWWASIWASPMAAAWLDSDVHTLYRLAALMEMTNTGKATAAVLAEVRQLEDRYGLSPLARRRLQWEVEQARGDSTKVERRSTGDPRLHVIEGGGR